MTAPDVSVVVCTRNRSEMLARALSDLVRQRELRAGAYEIVVVNDASTDDTEAVVENIARATSEIAIRSVRGLGSGIGSARNVGITAATGRWIAFFDDDQRAQPNWLADLLATAQCTDADLVGGPVELDLPHGSHLGPVGRAVYGEHPTWRQRRRGTVPHPAGGNRLVDRRVFEQIGAHDETMATGEDRELVFRALAAGLSFGWSDTAVVHHEITLDRLEDHALRSYSTRAGGARAVVDHKRFGASGLVLRAATVVLKLIANTMLWGWAQATGRDLEALDHRIRHWLYSGYLEAAGRRLRSVLGRAQSPPQTGAATSERSAP